MMMTENDPQPSIDDDDWVQELEILPAPTAGDWKPGEALAWLDKSSGHFMAISIALEMDDPQVRKAFAALNSDLCGLVQAAEHAISGRRVSFVHTGDPDKKRLVTETVHSLCRTRVDGSDQFADLYDALLQAVPDIPEASEGDAQKYEFSVTDVLDASQVETVHDEHGGFPAVGLTLIPPPELRTHADLPIAISGLLPWLEAACDLVEAADENSKATRILSEIEDILQAIDQGFRLNQVPKFVSEPTEDVKGLIEAALTIQDRDDQSPSIRMLLQVACKMSEGCQRLTPKLRKWLDDNAVRFVKETT